MDRGGGKVGGGGVRNHDIIHKTLFTEVNEIGYVISLSVFIPTTLILNLVTLISFLIECNANG